MLNSKLLKKRLKVCETCPFYDPVLVKCKACKCFLKIKARIKSAKCPQDKWEREDGKKEET